MKRSLFTIFTLALLTFNFTINNQAKAANISLGVSTWYSFWDFTEGNNNSDIDPTILFGPVAAISFSEEWSLTMLLLYGKFDMHGGDNGQDRVTEVHRIDNDLALNYNLTKSFKLFGGIKYMGYFFNDDYHQGAGPAVGFGITKPLTSNLFVLFNASGMLLYGEQTSSQQEGDFEYKFLEYGANTNLSLAYYIQPWSTTLTCGGRYQIFKTDFTSSDNEGDQVHQFYGVTLAAIYNF